jgi:hypothetical protein
MEDLVYRLRKRAEIRRQIPTRKSVQENQPDRLSDLLEEAANEIERLKGINMNIEQLINDVVAQLDKDPMEQMVDTETIIRNYTKAIIKEYHDNLVVVNE